MDQRAISLVRTNFRAVTGSPHGPAQLTNYFYAHLFGENPGLRGLFPATMHMQRERLVLAIDFVIAALDDPDRVREFLRQLALDHRKYGVEAGHYPAAGRAIIAAMRDFTSAVFWTDAIDAAWTQVAELITTEMSIGAASDDLPSTWSATVVGHHRLRDDVALVRLRSETQIPYEPGQYLPVQIPQRGRMWRYLSPAIPTNPYGEIEFHVRKVRGGWVSPSIVNETQVGDRWTLGAPLGGLRVDRTSGRDVLMISSGTGIAPLRAQLMEMAMKGHNPRVQLFLGGRYPCDLYDVSNLWQLSITNPWLTVVPICENATDPWWYTGPPTELPEGIQRSLVGPIGDVIAGIGSWSDRQIQICGSATMIRSTRKALIRAGTPAVQISYDQI
ncbi:FAD-binding oxidoreductase [Skermania piniformis]|uniref:nitric oxide dioxygenase n=1 Tax=Skermania pinensis TaxID=39122 RepID=A0ABX8S940_9ACTN|nr:FAD-binding oxidoreductase [Skermania piniformis]QXQ13677.1 flavoprotein [Skermania piniformis]